MEEWKIAKIFDVIGLYSENSLMNLEKSLLVDIFLQRDIEARRERIKEEISGVIKMNRDLGHEQLIAQVFSFQNIWDGNTTFEYKFIQSVKSAPWFRNSFFRYMQLFSKFRYFQHPNFKFERRDRLEVERSNNQIRDLPHFPLLIKMYGFMRGLDYLYKLLDAQKDKKTDMSIVNFKELEKIATLTMVKEAFNSFHKDGWEYFFERKSYFETVCIQLAKFLDKEDYDIPDLTIPLKSDSETKAARVFRKIQKDAKRGPLVRDKKFFEFLKIIEDFQKYTKEEMYDKLT